MDNKAKEEKVEIKFDEESQELIKIGIKQLENHLKDGKDKELKKILEKHLNKPIDSKTFDDIENNLYLFLEKESEAIIRHLLVFRSKEILEEMKKLGVSKNLADFFSELLYNYSIEFHKAYILKVDPEKWAYADSEISYTQFINQNCKIRTKMLKANGEIIEFSSDVDNFLLLINHLLKNLNNIETAKLSIKQENIDKFTQEYNKLMEKIKGEIKK